MMGPEAMNRATAAGKVSSSANSSAAVLAVDNRRFVAGAQFAAEIRQQHHADGHPDHAERQLEDAVGVIEPRHDAILEARDDGRDDDGDLRHAAGDEARHGEATSRRMSGLSEGRSSRSGCRRAAAAMATMTNLQQAGDRNAPGERHAGDLCSPLPVAMSPSSTAISTTLSRLGAKAATAKRPSALSSPV